MAARNTSRLLTCLISRAPANPWIPADPWAHGRRRPSCRRRSQGRWQQRHQQQRRRPHWRVRPCGPPRPTEYWRRRLLEAVQWHPATPRDAPTLLRHACPSGSGGRDRMFHVDFLARPRRADSGARRESTEPAPAGRSEMWTGPRVMCSHPTIGPSVLPTIGPRAPLVANNAQAYIICAFE